MTFENKVVLVTGGSSGIGLATARAFAQRGAHVWILARDQAKLDTALQSLKAGRVNEKQCFGAISADVSDHEKVKQAVDQITQAAGLPDIVINSAGVAHPGYVQDLDLDIYKWTMNINYFGTVHITKAVLPGMVSRGSGHIVNISSMAGFLGVFGYTAYGATKYAVRGFSDALRAEMKPLGIRVSIVFPPDVDTPELAYENQFKPFETKEIAASAKVMQPEEVARAILSGIERRRYIILPGFEAKFYYYLANLAGNGVYPIMDLLISMAQKKKKKQAKD